MVFAWTIYLLCSLCAFTCWWWLSGLMKFRFLIIIARVTALVLCFTPVTYDASVGTQYAPAIAAIAIELIANGWSEAQPFFNMLMFVLCVTNITIFLLLLAYEKLAKPRV